MSLKDNFLYINHKKSYMNRDKKHIQRKDTRTNKDFLSETVQSRVRRNKKQSM